MAVGTLNIVFPILPIYWAPSLLSDNAKSTLNCFDNKPSNLEICPNKQVRKQYLKRGKRRTCGINFNPLTARWGRAYDYKSQIPCNAYSGQRLVTAFMSFRPPRSRAFAIQNFSDCAKCKAVILFRFSPESSYKRRRFLNQEEKCDFLITLTTLLGSCHSYHIHTISPISLTIFSLSRRLRTVVGQSPNIHTKLMGSWRGQRNHRSLLCLDWTHSLWKSCTLQNPILELGPNSSSRRGGRMWCGILWLRKERVEWGWCVVRPSKSFIQSPTLWAWPGEFIGGLKVMQSAVTNTVFVAST